MLSPMVWLSRQEIVALGWTLLHFCWQGTAVAILFAMVDRITSHATSRVRYVVALAAFLLMPIIVIGTFSEELRVATQAHSTTRTTLSASPITAPPVGNAAQILSSLHLGISPKPTLHPLPLASSLEESTDWLATRADRILPWVDALWLVGVLFLALRSLGGWWHLGLIRQHAQRMVPHEVERAFLRLCEQIQVGRKVVLRASDEVISPLAMGVWRATVILPISAVLSMPREELEAVLAHELGHIRRWDYLCNLLQTAVESLLFFHPAVWWLSRTVRERREVCCDEIAVQNCSDAAVYARALLRLEEQRTVRLRLAMAFDGCGGSLLGRIRKVLGEDMALEGKMTSGTSVAAVGALVLTLLLGPKISQAVANPTSTRMQPVVAHVMKTLPEVVVSQLNAASTRTFIPQAVANPQAQAIPQAQAVPQAEAPQAPLPPLKPSASVAAPVPMPQIQPHVLISHSIAVNAVTASSGELELQESSGTGSGRGTGTGSGQASGTLKGTAYLDDMRDAGYPLDLDNDLNSLVALKSLGVTPEYAKAMGVAGLGKPTVHELIALKSMGITPDYVASLKQSGIAPANFHEVVTEKSLGITPQYATEMKQKGFGDLNLHELITMKSVGVTPEYAAEMKQKGFGDLSVHELITMKSLGVTPEYAAEMKQKGFGDISVHELISLKAQGMTPEYAGWLKQTFPQATTDELRRAAVFHLDDKFVADAKTYGFAGNDLDKLLKLKMSGLLDQ
jgi:beta-lactamase regulating signal transducer with metallopeptidase domain